MTPLEALFLLAAGWLLNSTVGVIVRTYQDS
jgi:hypothetical protein